MRNAATDSASSSQTTAQPAPPSGLAPCTRCAARGVVRIYSEFGAARRTPYESIRCPVCKGLGQALATPPEQLAAAIPWLPLSMIAALVVLMLLL